ncbi:MAG TPA: NADH-quinone oxidoreductase subunit L [Pyrinomonadaceae bacterium]|jgi:NADH-quinone oxidoreductase subunit L|nr:NADH-quinone oxidoreductase subunit L [Pyrinomonadaceae bacterium]
MEQTQLLSLIIFAPLAGAAINWLIGRRVRSEVFVGTVACGAVGISTVVAFYLFFKSGGALQSEGPLLNHIWTWIEVGRFRADFALSMDRLSGVYALFVTFVAFLIHIFAVGYMRGDQGFYRFFAYLNLFMFSMLTLVLADNFLLMFVGWEGVGLCSYLLIGYYFDRKEAGDAAKKAFITNRVGDWGFVLGIMLIFSLTGSISFVDKGTVVSSLSVIGNMSAEPFLWNTIWAGGITSIAVLLFIGATGKSAQIPLFVWLPDAMAGPTPVSALIHAATMVTAGVYMIVRCNAIFSHAPTAMFIVAIIGAATALFAATIGLGQNDIKKVLAYSTISQLGYMFLACGLGAFVAAIFHVITHAFFKALLFLGSGSVINGMHHEQDMRRMGRLRKYMPITFATMMMGWLAICGIPIWAGFFSKDEILWKTWSARVLGVGAAALPPGAAKVLWFIAALTALLTAIYMTRLMVMTFFGSERFREAADDHGHEAHDHGAGGHHEVHEPHESSWLMTGPLIILAILSTLGGFMGVSYAVGSLVSSHPVNYLERTLEPIFKSGESEQPAENVEWLSPPPQAHDGAPAVTFSSPGAAEETHSPAEISEERMLAGLSILIGAAGIGIGFWIYGRRPLLQMPSIIRNKYYVDEVYDATIIRPINKGSRELLWKIFDQDVIDGILHAIGKAVTEAGGVIRYLQIGFVRSYAAIILIGALAIIGFFSYFVTRLR